MYRLIFASSANTAPQMSQILLLKRLIHCTDFFFTAPFLSLHWFFSLHRFFFTAPIFLSLHRFFFSTIILHWPGERTCWQGFPLRKECGMSNIKFSNLPPRPFMKGSFLSPNSKYERTTWCWKRIKMIIGWPTPLLSCRLVPHLRKRGFSSANLQRILIFLRGEH